METPHHAHIPPPNWKKERTVSEPTETQEQQKMADTANFFDGAQGSGSTAGGVGLGAGVGGLIGAALGNGGLFGNNNREPAVTPDQLGTAMNNLQNQINTDQLEDRVSDSAIALGAGIAGVKDAVNHASSHNALALCGLGHSVQAGFASVNQSILMQGAQSRELALQQALDAERARATELRIALSEHKNQAGHNATQVLLNQVINAK